MAGAISEQRFTSMRFSHFKAFRQYAVSLRHFNVLVGPNNCGKSTVLSAFRILAEAMRKAAARRPTLVSGPTGDTWGYSVDLSGVPIATENVFFNYDDSRPASVTFRVSNGNQLHLFFPTSNHCSLICEVKDTVIQSPAQFKRHFNVPVSFVPILGPVEHNETLYQQEAARLALLTHRASRNFRNIWHHYPEQFDEFRALVKTTWPGMDIESPRVDYSYSPPRLHMFCPEERIPREIYWAGFGFQVWCQMLTYIIRGRNASLLFIDEPDIYLHSDLQRQLLGLLKSLGPDIVIATHSTEIVSEAEPDDILIVNKKAHSARRISDPGQLQCVFQSLGSNLNPILTQLAKTKRALFVEGKDFQVLSRFARRLGMDAVANRTDFAVIPIEGFNPSRVVDIIKGAEATLGTVLLSGVILDRDYRAERQCKEIEKELRKFCALVRIHKRKELENFLLAEMAISRAIERRLSDHNKRSQNEVSFEEDVAELLLTLSEPLRHKVEARYLEQRRAFEKQVNRSLADETITERLMAEYDKAWANMSQRLFLVPGKEMLSSLNTYLQTNIGVSITATGIVDAFRVEEIAPEMTSLLKDIDLFRRQGTDQ